ncbi:MULTISPECIES: sensor histidine kinase [Jonquetella]|uniref:sensor histidine kinase n=1 Tax=Jonquetella TaxID=428711 RepID=UPI0003ADA532|nr:MULTISPECIES: sensor histidine kinase [Jonquetella]ERL24516.1 GHKL domain protein [Jonquetella sp. BV3C21]
MKIRVRRSLPLVLVLSLVIPMIVVVGVTLFSVSAHERAMGRVMESYVLNVAQSAAAKINGIGILPFRANKVMLQMERLNLFSWGSKLPGWVVVLDSGGDVVVSSQETDPPVLSLTRSILLNKALEVHDASGHLYTVAVCPTGRPGMLDTFYVVAAVRWNDLLGPLLRTNRLMISMVFVLAAALFAAGIVLWRWVIAPLSKISDEASRLNWGDEVACETDKQAVYEISRLRYVLCRLSQSACDRISLWKRYSSDMVRVQEDEKESIAREIHDGPVQAVTALGQRIRLAQMDEQNRSEHLKVAEEIAFDTVKELREMCNHLTPPWLDLGLEHALNELAERLSRYLGVTIRVVVHDEKLQPEGVLTFFRILQEAVSNAVKHGGADQIDVRVDRPGDRRTRMIVEDNGKGFAVPADLESLRASGHRGLLNMRDRIRLVNGEMIIRSVPGRSTTLTFFIPDSDGGAETRPQILSETGRIVSCYEGETGAGVPLQLGE